MTDFTIKSVQDTLSRLNCPNPDASCGRLLLQGLAQPNVMSNIMANTFRDMETLRKSLKEYTVKYHLEEDKLSYLRKTFPEFDIIMKVQSHHDHALIAIIDEIFRLREVPRHFGDVQRVLEIGSKLTKIAAGLKEMAYNRPIIDSRDATRFRFDLNWLKMKHESLLWKSERSLHTKFQASVINHVLSNHCNHTLEVCNCSTDAYFLNHVALSIDPVVLFRAMIRNSVPLAVCIFTFMPEVLFVDYVEHADIGMVAHWGNTRYIATMVKEHGKERVRHLNTRGGSIFFKVDSAATPYEHSYDVVNRWYRLPSDVYFEGHTFKVYKSTPQAGSITYRIEMNEGTIKGEDAVIMEFPSLGEPAYMFVIPYEYNAVQREAQQFAFLPKRLFDTEENACYSRLDDEINFSAELSKIMAHARAANNIVFVRGSYVLHKQAKVDFDKFFCALVLIHAIQRKTVEKNMLSQAMSLDKLRNQYLKYDKLHSIIEMFSISLSRWFWGETRHGVRGLNIMLYETVRRIEKYTSWAEYSEAKKGLTTSAAFESATMFADFQRLEIPTMPVDSTIINTNTQTEYVEKPSCPVFCTADEIKSGKYDVFMDDAQAKVLKDIAKGMETTTYGSSLIQGMTTDGDFEKKIYIYAPKVSGGLNARPFEVVESYKAISSAGTIAMLRQQAVETLFEAAERSMLLLTTFKLTGDITAVKRNDKGKFNMPVTGDTYNHCYWQKKFYDVTNGEPVNLPGTVDSVLVSDTLRYFHAYEHVKIYEQFHTINIKPIKVIRIKGVPGAYKTKTTIAIADPKTDLIVTNTKAAKEDIEKRLNEKDVVVRTIDSATVTNLHKRGHDFQRLLVDEADMMHYGQILFVAYLFRVNTIVLIGDPNQIPYINWIPGVKPVWHELPQSQNDLRLEVSGRIPQKVCQLLMPNYNGRIFTSNSEKCGLDSIETQDVIAVLTTMPDYVFITSTQHDKQVLLQHFGNSRKIYYNNELLLNTIMSAHESQGQTFDKVADVRLDTTEQKIYDLTEAGTVNSWQLVALSRAKQKVVYVTAKTNDPLHKLIQGVLATPTPDIFRPQSAVEEGVKNITKMVAEMRSAGVRTIRRVENYMFGKEGKGYAYVYPFRLWPNVIKQRDFKQTKSKGLNSFTTYKSEEGDEVIIWDLEFDDCKNKDKRGWNMKKLKLRFTGITRAIIPLQKNLGALETCIFVDDIIEFLNRIDQIKFFYYWLNDYIAVAARNNLSVEVLTRDVLTTEMFAEVHEELLEVSPAGWDTIPVEYDIVSVLHPSVADGEVLLLSTAMNAASKIPEMGLTSVAHYLVENLGTKTLCLKGIKFDDTDIDEDRIQQITNMLFCVATVMKHNVNFCHCTKDLPALRNEMTRRYCIIEGTHRGRIVTYNSGKFTPIPFPNADIYACLTANVSEATVRSMASAFANCKYYIYITSTPVNVANVFSIKCGTAYANLVSMFDEKVERDEPPLVEEAKDTFSPFCSKFQSNGCYITCILNVLQCLRRMNMVAWESYDGMTIEEASDKLWKNSEFRKIKYIPGQQADPSDFIDYVLKENARVGYIHESMYNSSQMNETIVCELHYSGDGINGHWVFMHAGKLYGNIGDVSAKCYIYLKKQYGGAVANSCWRNTVSSVVDHHIQKKVDVSSFDAISTSEAYDAVMALRILDAKFHYGLTADEINIDHFTLNNNVLAYMQIDGKMHWEYYRKVGRLYLNTEDESIDPRLLKYELLRAIKLYVVHKSVTRGDNYNESIDAQNRQILVTLTKKAMTLGSTKMDADRIFSALYSTYMLCWPFSGTHLLTKNGDQKYWLQTILKTMYNVPITPLSVHELEEKDVKVNFVPPLIPYSVKGIIPMHAVATKLHRHHVVNYNNLKSFEADVIIIPEIAARISKRTADIIRLYTGSRTKIKETRLFSSVSNISSMYRSVESEGDYLVYNTILQKKNWFRRVTAKPVEPIREAQNGSAIFDELKPIERHGETKYKQTVLENEHDGITYKRVIIEDVKVTGRRKQILDLLEAQNGVSGPNDFIAHIIQHAEMPDEKDRLDEPTIGTIDIMQDAYDAAMPGVANFDQQWLGEMLLTSPLDYHIDWMDIKPDALDTVVKDVKTYYEPNLKTGKGYRRDNNQPEIIEAVAKRNQHPNRLQLITDPNIFAEIVVQNFLDNYCVDNVAELIKEFQATPVTTNSTNVSLWLETQTGPKLSRLIANGIRGLNELPVPVYDISIKRDVKSRMNATKVLHEYAKVQVIAAHDADLTLYYSPDFRQLVERLKMILKSNVLINIGYTDQELDRFITRYSTFDLDHQGFIEMDFASFDKTQQIVAHTIKMLMYKMLGMDQNMLEIWENGHQWSVNKSRTAGIKFWTEYQQKSGDASTTFGNCILCALMVAYVFRHNPMDYMLILGDDNLTGAAGFIPTLEQVLDFGYHFNVEAKLISQDEFVGNGYFCGKFVVPHGGTVKLMPDPLKMIDKLGHHTTRTADHLRAQFESFKDLCKAYGSEARNAELAKYVSRRYHCEHDFTEAINSLYVYSRDFNRFSTLFSRNSDVSLNPEDVVRFASCTLLSNMHRCNFSIDNQNYTSVEKYYMAMKAEFHGATTKKDLIMKLDQPKMIKTIGKTITGTKDWYDNHASGVMLKAVLSRMKTDVAYRNLILSSGDKLIIECVPGKSKWSCGFSKNDPRTLTPWLWIGLNLTGDVLMNARSIYKDKQAP